MISMKVIAMYLPQFHKVKENDEWWGDGFTEWTAVQNAEPLYEGHFQPRIPLNHNYYNLLDKKTMLWQEDLIQQYGIYGFCFYHYWFKDGRQILEKPAENLLRWTDIHIPFCFSWANESWARTWSNLGEKNVWTDKFEDFSQKTANVTGILLEQKYGTEENWKEHFEYLLPFFMDKRYIKIDNKPVFLIYKPDLIPCLSRMVKYWEKLAVEHGLAGIYLIGMNTSKENVFAALLYHEPQKTIGQFFNRQNYSVYVKTERKAIEYIDLWQKIIARTIESESKIYLGGFLGYDDTPRRGTGGCIVEGCSPHDFYVFLKKLLLKSERLGNEYVFLNAWNEWGEGMYLEPDEKDGYSYLEAVRTALRDYKMDTFIEEPHGENSDINQTDIVRRYKGYWKMLNKWLTLKENGVKLQTYLQDRNIHTIAIYGLGMLGFHLVRELEGSDIQIVCAIDRKGRNLHTDFPVYLPGDAIPHTDAIIVTVIYLFEQIVEQLEKKVDCPIISLEELLEEL